jgi:polyisoprenoid-binding protein YceI
MIIHGTSTLHNWQCKVEQPSGQLIAEMENGNIKNIKSLALGVIVLSIKSIDEKGAYYEKSMDKNVYKALQAEKFPNITFTLSRINKKVLTGKSIILEAVGILRIAGVNREILVQVQSIPMAGGIMFEGKLPIKMTDYKIEPPTAIFGTIKTGDEVTLDFKMAYLLQPSK